METNIPKTFLVIPAYNEVNIISDVIKEVKDAGYENIIVVDDGSSDRTYQKAKESGVVALRLCINRGKGAAVKTGVTAAKILGAEIIITMDADGQHNPLDAKKMEDAIKQGADVVLGSRLINPKGMPFHKKIANKIGNLITWILCGIYVSDSQSGFRAYSKKAMDLINTRNDRYEYDSEVIREISKNKLSFIEMPIEVRYTEYSINKKSKMNFSNGIKIIIKLILS